MSKAKNEYKSLGAIGTTPITIIADSCERISGARFKIVTTVSRAIRIWYIYIAWHARYTGIKKTYRSANTTSS